MPLFSVIIPAYNRAGIISRAIQSVLDQTCNDYEVIVVDDGSTDDTNEVLKPWIDRNQIRYIYQHNRGVCAARNAGASMAQGEYLVFLDSDDAVEPSWLYDYAEAINRYPKLDLVFCSMVVFKPDGSSKKLSCLDPYSNGGKQKGLPIPGTWAIKNSFFNELGGYDESLKYGENTELRFRWKAQSPNYHCIDRYNLIYMESVSGGSKQTENKLKSNLYILEKHADYFKENPRVKRLFLQVAAVSAVRLKDTRQAHGLFVQAWKTNPIDIKLMIQCLITLVPLIAKRVWS